MKGQFPWIGRSRGSAGGMTTAKINDKNVMRAKAFDVTNPNTPAQQMQRDFFKQVQEVCASVSEDQLRSLFGVKPKTMTRRNALSKQIAAAYTITNNVKSVDFSKLGAIGNGEKVNTPIVHKLTDDIIVNLGSPSLLNLEDPSASYCVIYVLFDVTDSKIMVINAGFMQGSANLEYEFVDEPFSDHEIYLYATTTTKQENYSLAPFGTFTIKTRATD